MVEEKLSYYEARSWFWLRTFVWLVPAFLAAGICTYFFWDYYELTGSENLRFWLSACEGIATGLIGLLGAVISLQTPWMRLGRRYGFVLNGPTCAIVSGIAAFLLCGAILSILQNDPYHSLSQANTETAYLLMQFGLGASIFWGFVLGSWFAMRRDKYFVEQI